MATVPPTELEPGNEGITPLAPGEIETDNQHISDANADLSWAEQVKEERDEQVEDEFLRLGMPTWGEPERPNLAVEFEVMPEEQFRAFQRESRKAARKKGDGAATDADIRFLCDSTRAVYMRRPDTGKLVRLEKDGVPIGLDKRLGKILKLNDEQMENSRALLMYLTKGNGLALGNMSGTVAKWMTNTSAEVEGAVLGE